MCDVLCRDLFYLMKSCRLARQFSLKVWKGRIEAEAEGWVDLWEGREKILSVLEGLIAHRLSSPESCMGVTKHRAFLFISGSWFLIQTLSNTMKHLNHRVFQDLSHKEPMT